MRPLRSSSLAVFVVALAGCGPSYKLTPTATSTLSPKPATCDFRVVNIPPQGNFEEIATLTPDPGAYDPETFKKTVQADVCRVGGDIVVTEVNGNGYYVRGTVLRAAR